MSLPTNDVEAVERFGERYRTLKQEVNKVIICLLYTSRCV